MKKRVLLAVQTGVALLFFTTLTAAQETGKAWEFNRDGDFEGIILSSAFKDSTVEDGYLKATTTKLFPSISSADFKVQAAQYGYVQMRVKMPGGTSVRLLWDNDAGQWGFSRLAVAADTSFRLLEFPVYLSEKWVGKIVKIKRLEFNVPIGSHIIIDFIRIIRIGEKPTVKKFLPLRSVIKPNKEIPLLAIVKNDGDVAAHLNSTLVLPQGALLLKGALDHDHDVLFKEESDTLSWRLKFADIGDYDIKLKVFSKTDTTEKSLLLHVTNAYWKPHEFLQSAWSPPYAWYGPPYEDDVFTDYKEANFEQVLWVRDDKALIEQIHRHRLKYFLLVTPVFGEDLLRGVHDETPPPVTGEMLQKLDKLIDKYKDDPDLLGYHICDEPHVAAFPNIARVVAKIREKDPTRLSFVNIWPNVARDKGSGAYIEELLQTTKLELLSYDRYHFFNGYDQADSYFNNLKLIRQYAQKYDIPFCNIIQAIGTNGTRREDLNWRTPNAAEHRFLVYSSLAYGVHGLIWFHWHSDWGVTGNPDREIIYSSLRDLNAEIDSLSQIMLHLKSTGVYHTKSNYPDWRLPSNGIIREASNGVDLIIGYFKDDKDNENYFMLMNKNYSNRVVTQVTMNYSLDSLKLFDVENHAWETVPFENSDRGATFDVQFRPGGGKLFRFSGQAATAATAPGSAPAQFTLQQNYPNPFNERTTIAFRLGKAQNVELDVYNMNGQKVRTLLKKNQKAGRYAVQFNAAGLASGLYFYRLQAGQVVKIKRMILLR